MDIAIRFAPHTEGTQAANLIIKTATQTFSCSLVGEATAQPPVMSATVYGNGRVVQTGGGGYTSTLNGTDFGQLNQEEDPWRLNQFIIKNTGNVPWIIDPASVAIVKQIAFDIYSTQPSGIIEPNEEWFFVVRFEGGFNSGIYLDTVILDIASELAGIPNLATSFKIAGTVNNTGLL